ncbi:MAG: DUF488 domain-containing protein [Bacteroidetes bacterium]|nr:DUF488 domain-containing protein [Bacteroidota bacterium]
MEKRIYTIGHSTHSIDEFILMLKSFDVEILADIRSFPGSRRYPHFNKENLELSLTKNNIEYVHFKELGGRRKANPDSKNIAWRSETFRGYADYMETKEFKSAIDALQKIAEKKVTTYMCAEAVWWSCHRSLVSDYLKVRGWEVMHIMSIEKLQEHPYTSAANIVNGKLDYTKIKSENYDLFE